MGRLGCAAVGIARRKRRSNDVELQELRDLQREDHHIGFDDLPGDDPSIVVADVVATGVLVLPDEVFQALDLTVLSGGQRRRVLTRVLTGILVA